jgi:hypothetical protein
MELWNYRLFSKIGSERMRLPNGTDQSKAGSSSKGQPLQTSPIAAFAQNALAAKMARANQKMTTAVRATVNPARVLFVEVTMTPTVRSTNLTFVEIRIVASPASDCIHLLYSS